MSNARSNRTNHRGTVKELLTEASLSSLSSALLDRGIDPHAILAIVESARPEIVQEK